MIAMVQPLSIGNALRLFIEPPSSAVRWRILRKSVNAFASEADPNAMIAYEGDDRVILDTTALVNESMAFYRPYYFDGAVWTAGIGNFGTPKADYADLTTDVLSFLRERLEAGLLVEVQRQNITSSLGYVRVFNSAPSFDMELGFPLVTVHLDSEDPSDGGLGQSFSDDCFDEETGLWSDSDGYLASVQVTVIAWSLNADERIELRKAIRRIVIGNLPVFSNLGWLNSQIVLRDMDSISGEYPAPVFQVMGTFSCIAPVRISGHTDPISDVTVTNLESL